MSLEEIRGKRVLERVVAGGRLRAGIAFASGAVLLAWAAAPWILRGSPSRRRTIVFYGFSILGEAIEEGVFPAFQARWKARTGETVELVGSFAGSGTITNQIRLGAPAEIALVALELDAERIAAGGAAEPDSWKKLPHAGVVNRTPFVILVRPGNPKGIRDFADLARPGVRVVHPDPQTSGGALWSILAEWGAGERRRPGGGRDLLLGVWRNVVAQAASARAARTQFENGFGDALVTYEQEALRRSAGDAPFEIVYPRATTFAEHTLVVVSRNVPRERRALVEAFAAFLWSDEAQRTFVRYGFRSADGRFDRENPAFGAIAEPFSVADLGGWPRAKADVIDRVWRDDVMKRVGR
ncbi:MAG TPA: substrate-binding domain-containing protein [Thermoanaerobaculia bacterium]|nr:substrate-binding domain-containing protein [Thermoanaerobaculia bacterium]